MRRRRKGRKKQRLSVFGWGLAAIIVIALFTYGGFTKFANPLAHHFTLHAIFTNTDGIKQGSFVRIAGVNVGQVTGIKDVGGSPTANVTMTIQDNGLPIHKDATFAIRPRIFLEGNFFVDVSPGSPSSPAAPNGYTFSPSQSTVAVQLDQVLGSLQANTRANLQVLLKEYGSAIFQSAGSYNASIPYWLPAYKYSSIVSHDFLGTQPNDLSKYIGAMGQVAAALNAHPQALQSLITDFNTTAAAFARQNLNLERTVADLPVTLAAATPALHALNAAFPPLRRFAVAFKPGVVSSGPAIDASLPFITQLRLLVRPQELEGLTHDLAGTIPALANLTHTTIPFMRNGVRPASSCVENIVLPWSHLTLNDPNFNASNGFPARPVYVEGLDYLPGLAGESRNFDANGPYVRVLVGGGTLTYSLQPGLFGQALAPIESAEPKIPASNFRPPIHPTIPCETQAPITTVSDAQSASSPKAVDTSKLTPATSVFQTALTKVTIAQLDKQLATAGQHVKLNGAAMETAK